MEAENTTQEVEEIIDLTLLCEHCPFAPQKDGGTAQEVTQERAQKQPVDERQMMLPFAAEFDEDVTPESDASDPQKERNEALQNLLISYLMQEHFLLNNDEEIASQAESDSEQKSEPRKHTKILASEAIILLSGEGEISVQETARSDAKNHPDSDTKNEITSMARNRDFRAYQTGTAMLEQRHAKNAAHRTPKQGQEAER